MPRPPEILVVDRIDTPVGEGVIVVDAAGALRAFDWTDYEARMRLLLRRQNPPVELREGRAPEAVRGAFGAYFAGFVILPQWQQVWLGYTATQAGYSSSFTAIAGLLTAPLVVMLMPRFDPRLLVSAGIFWISTVGLMRVFWTSDSDFWTLSLPQFVSGLGMTFFMLPIINLTLNTVEEHEVASAAGLQSFMRTIATAFATSVSLTYWGDTQRAARNDIAGVLHHRFKTRSRR